MRHTQCPHSHNSQGQFPFPHSHPHSSVHSSQCRVAPIQYTPSWFRKIIVVSAERDNKQNITKTEKHNHRQLLLLSDVGTLVSPSHTVFLLKFYFGTLQGENNEGKTVQLREESFPPPPSFIGSTYLFQAPPPSPPFIDRPDVVWLHDEVLLGGYYYYYLMCCSQCGDAAAVRCKYKYMYMNPRGAIQSTTATIPARYIFNTPFTLFWCVLYNSHVFYLYFHHTIIIIPVPSARLHTRRVPPHDCCSRPPNINVPCPLHPPSKGG